MRRVVITGLGIVSCPGNDKETVSGNLRAGRPGIRFNQSYADMGLRSRVSGSVNLNLEELIDRKVLRFMGDAAAYAYPAMEQAVKDAGFSPMTFPIRVSARWPARVVHRPSIRWKPSISCATRASSASAHTAFRAP